MRRYEGPRSYNAFLPGSTRKILHECQTETEVNSGEEESKKIRRVDKIGTKNPALHQSMICFSGWASSRQGIAVTG